MKGWLIQNAELVSLAFVVCGLCSFVCGLLVPYLFIVGAFGFILGLIILGFYAAESCEDWVKGIY